MNLEFGSGQGRETLKRGLGGQSAWSGDGDCLPFVQRPKGQREHEEGFGRCPTEEGRWVVKPNGNEEILQTFK